MKVTAVEIYQLELSKGGRPWHPVLIRVLTDEGMAALEAAGNMYPITISRSLVVACRWCHSCSNRYVGQLLSGHASTGTDSGQA